MIFSNLSDFYHSNRLELCLVLEPQVQIQILRYTT